MELIANTDLRPENIPSPASDMETIFEFAQSFDGYERWGSERCGEIANAKKHRTLTEVRTCLFYEHRRYRHMDATPRMREELYIRGLVQKILAMVVAGKTT